jgi:hypothetical protein
MTTMRNLALVCVTTHCSGIEYKRQTTMTMTTETTTTNVKHNNNNNHHIISTSTTTIQKMTTPTEATIDIWQQQ